MFSHHLDRKRENLEWGTRSVLTGIGTSIAAIGGGFLADHYGFPVIFILTGLLAIFGSSLLIYSRHKDFERGHLGLKGVEEPIAKPIAEIV